MADELLEQAAASDGIERQGLVLAGLTRLKQVCNHPAHYLADGTDLAGRSGKLARCEELIDAILDTGEKALLFTQYTNWGERLAVHLARQPFAPSVAEGHLSERTPQGSPFGKGARTGRPPEGSRPGR